ncbi:integrase [Nostoc sp. CENA67]|uniref:Integrase n=1 Tax=Amazonocrinis nigriterrae CENA67 TaxID=2794033 RepID=A0A8J7LAI5_9NOST|nr:integrase [Amazonocrinis nigriterrae]MBH8566689.1 integrase [Amazonocrinis nigriterrae CENA67]
MDAIDQKIQQANERLKKKGTRVVIYRRENRLWLRGTLPPKPHINKNGDYSQFVSLGKNAIASEKGIKYATAKAMLLTGQLQAGTFDWADWIDLDKVAPNRVEARLVKDWCAEYEKDYWQRIKRTPEREANWKKDHGLVFSKLSHDEPLTIEVLLNYIRSTEPDSRSRKRACDYCYKLAEFAQLEGIEQIRKLTGNYSVRSVDPRSLPSDKEIFEFCDSIKTPSWRWVVRMMATYGLRNYEAFRLDLQDFPTIRVLNGKTGKRIVVPLYPEWADAWQLHKICLPDISLDYANSKIGTKVSGWFFDNKAPFSAYNLRHSYARRCFEFDIAPDRAAKFMGHSLSVHLQVYRAWFDEAVYLADYAKAIAKPDRPKPPNY